MPNDIRYNARLYTNAPVSFDFSEPGEFIITETKIGIPGSVFIQKQLVQSVEYHKINNVIDVLIIHSTTNVYYVSLYDEPENTYKLLVQMLSMQSRIETQPQSFIQEPQNYAAQTLAKSNAGAFDNSKFNAILFVNAPDSYDNFESGEFSITSERICIPGSIFIRRQLITAAEFQQLDYSRSVIIIKTPINTYYLNIPDESDETHRQIAESLSCHDDLSLQTPQNSNLARQNSFDQPKYQMLQNSNNLDFADDAQLKMSFSEAVKTCFRKYADFSGRARRSEYWYFYLLTMLIVLFFYILLFVIAVANIDSGSDINFNTGAFAALLIIIAITTIVMLALVVPNIAVSVRRLHDIGKSGGYYFLCCIPYVGPIILLVFLAKDSEPFQNQYGPCPKRFQ